MEKFLDAVKVAFLIIMLFVCAHSCGEAIEHDDYPKETIND